MQIIDVKPLYRGDKTEGKGHLTSDLIKLRPSARPFVCPPRGGAGGNFKRRECNTGFVLSVATLRTGGRWRSRPVKRSMGVLPGWFSEPGCAFYFYS